MKRVVRIGHVNLSNPLWVEESLKATKNTASAKRTVAGAMVIYEMSNRYSALYITLDSRNYGWLKTDDVNALIGLADSSLGQQVEIEYRDGSTEMARFAYEQANGAVQATPLFDGANWYKVKIYMAKVE
ncbi:MAG: hypothetical protein DRI61_04155 [Chloroflexi bacterium]|nr:MAG: hypothetical protein DRI61_04155 [Chloroflexota bacterium]